MGSVEFCESSDRQAVSTSGPAESTHIFHGFRTIRDVSNDITGYMLRVFWNWCLIVGGVVIVASGLLAAGFCVYDVWSLHQQELEGEYIDGVNYGADFVVIMFLAVIIGIGWLALFWANRRSAFAFTPAVKASFALSVFLLIVFYMSAISVRQQPVPDPTSQEPASSTSR